MVTRSVTDTRSDPYAPVPAPVTCAECQQVIPPDAATVIAVTGLATERRYCWPCAESARWPLRDLIIPWLRNGARLAGRRSDEYSRTCPACGRWFIGAVARRYCSARCGERTRNGAPHPVDEGHCRVVRRVRRPVHPAACRRPVLLASLPPARLPQPEKGHAMTMTTRTAATASYLEGTAP